MDAHDRHEILQFFVNHGFHQELGTPTLALLAYLVVKAPLKATSCRQLSKETGLHRHTVKEKLVALQDSGFLMKGDLGAQLFPLDVQMPRWKQTPLE
jgi:DNA-binding IclR family transcriptional regulator